MNDKFLTVKNAILSDVNNTLEVRQLFSGINLFFYSSATKQVSFHHPKWEKVLEINYCSAGRISWDMGNRKQVFLGPGDFSLHTMNFCADSSITLPTGHYEGLTIWVDFSELEPGALPLLSLEQFSLRAYVEKFCKNGPFTSFAGSPLTTAIFSGLYQPDDAVGLALQKVKCLELLLYLLQIPLEETRRLTEYRAELVEIIHQIHRKLTADLRQRFTIEDLARQYALNTTTLKAVFKSVYGNSIAAHIKEHRLKQAAGLLRETDDSIAKISRAVGYESQSKFTAAFKAYFHTLPTEYRKINRGR